MLSWWLLPSIATGGDRVDGIFRLVFWAALATFAVVELGMLVAFLARRGDTRPVTRALAIEVAWLAIPALVLGLLTMSSVRVWNAPRTEANGAARP